MSISEVKLYVYLYINAHVLITFVFIISNFAGHNEEYIWLAATLINSKLVLKHNIILFVYIMSVLILFVNSASILI